MLIGYFYTCSYILVFKIQIKMGIMLLKISFKMCLSITKELQYIFFCSLDVSANIKKSLHCDVEENEVWLKHCIKEPSLSLLRKRRKEKPRESCLIQINCSSSTISLSSSVFPAYCPKWLFFFSPEGCLTSGLLVK